MKKTTVSGTVYRAPAGTVLPTDAKTVRDDAYKALGHIFEDGMENEISIDTDEIKARVGDTVGWPQKSKSQTFTLIQELDTDVLEAICNMDKGRRGTMETTKEELEDWMKLNREFDHMYKNEPYDHCGDCPMNIKNFNIKGATCKVADKYQRLPRDQYRGALGMCMKIGGRGC